MPNAKYNSPLINTLAKNELAIARLYRVFAEKVPEHAAFWESMAKAEDGHAGILDVLERNVGEGRERFSARRFGMNEVRRSLSAVLDEIRYASARGVTQRLALGKALGIERSLVENVFYEVVTGDSPNVAKMKQRMIKSIDSHVKLLERRLADSF